MIDGRFELLARLGGGGMGLVWRARDLALHRDVALKEVRPPDPALLEADPTAARMLRERVLREARALARLSHPHVVTIHHIVDSPDVPHPWLVMELVPGGSLEDRIARGSLSPGEAARIGRGVLSALRAAHAAGIHHRDVKPANVLLREDGAPVLTDFGIAALRESTSLTATGELIGSPEYIAPERARGEEDNPASDLWSLGMLLYIAVEGTHPMRRATSLATLAAVLTESVPPPVRSGPLTPVLTALLTRDPAARPDAGRLDHMLAQAETGAGAPGVAYPAYPAGPGATTTVVPVGAAGTGPGTPGAPGHAAFSVPGPSPESTRPAPNRRRARALQTTAAVAGTALVAGLAFVLIPNGDDDGGGPRRAAGGGGGPAATSTDPTGKPAAGDPGPSGAPSGAPVAAGAPATTGPPTASSRTPVVASGEDDDAGLLTPDGIRGVVETLRPVMGGTRVLDFTVYDAGHASAKAPAKSNPKGYDSFTYRDGRAEILDGFKGTIDEDDPLIDLATVNWDAIPGLLRTAERDLGVSEPTSRYVIVDSGLIDKKLRLLVYVSDEYGGGHLVADLKGRVQQKYPR